MDTAALEELLHRRLERSERQLAYAAAIREALPPEALAEVAERAREDAERGDGGARRWLRQVGADVSDASR